MGILPYLKTERRGGGRRGGRRRKGKKKTFNRTIEVILPEKRHYTLNLLSHLLSTLHIHICLLQELHKKYQPITIYTSLDIKEVTELLCSGFAPDI